MADIADQADETEALILQRRLAAVDPRIPQGTGYCLNCEEKLPKTQRWCDSDCRDDYEKRKRAERERAE